jgi:uncharacterized protein YacL
MTSELAFRILGLVIATFVGARVGAELAVPPLSEEVYVLIFGLSGALFGLVVTPYVTTRPANAARRVIIEMPAAVLVTSIIGLIFGLVVAALFAVPLGLLPQPLSQWLPSLVAIVTAYLGITIFGYRAQELFLLVRQLSRGETVVISAEPERPLLAPSDKIIMDSSAIIDGRILDISRTGFLNGELLVPIFVLQELQHIADDSDSQRRMRGKRGLEIVEEMKKQSKAPVRVIDADVENVREVDHKLIALCKEMNALLLTTDHNLNKLASLQNVNVLNVNDLTNAVKAVILPNEVITIQIIAEGREAGQGIGYLADGTMVVVEQGRRFLDRTIDVVITRMIQTTAGKMYFARPEDNPRK